MLVTIVYVSDAARRGPDTNRIGKVEDVPDDLASTMLYHGTARFPTPEELAAFNAAATDDASTAEQDKTAGPDADQQTTSDTEPAAVKHVRKARNQPPADAATVDA